jgi:hypothetical protein
LSPGLSRPRIAVLSRDFIPVWVISLRPRRVQSPASSLSSARTRGRVIAGNAAVAMAIAMIRHRAKSGRHSDPETEQR